MPSPATLPRIFRRRSPLDEIQGFAGGTLGEQMGRNVLADPVPYDDPNQPLPVAPSAAPNIAAPPANIAAPLPSQPSIAAPLDATPSLESIRPPKTRPQN